MSAITPYDWAIIAFVIGVTFLCVFMLTVPLLLGGKAWGRAKQEQFESGVVSAGGARIRLSAKFYLVAIFFVVFDFINCVRNFSDFLARRSIACI